MNHYTEADIYHMMFQMGVFFWGIPVAAVALFWVAMFVIVLIRGRKRVFTKTIARRAV